MAFLDLCCGSAGSDSRPWPVSGPSPVWTGPPCHGGCTSSSAAAQAAQRTCIWGHSPMTSLTPRWSSSQKVGLGYKILGFWYLRSWKCCSDWGHLLQPLFFFKPLLNWAPGTPPCVTLLCYWGRMTESLPLAFIAQGRERELELRQIQETSGELDRPKKEV